MKYNLFILLFLFLTACSSRQISSVNSCGVSGRLPSAAACENLFQEFDYVEFYTKYKNDIGVANDLLMKEIIDRSQALEKDLKEKKQLEYDFILVGAGIHTGVIMAQIKEQIPQARVLILEKSENSLSVFGRTGETFYGNTLESALPGTIHTTGQIAEAEELQLKSDSRNIIPGAPIQTYDVALNKIPRAADFAAPVITTYAKYKPDILFNVSVDQIKPLKNGGFSIELPRQLGTVTGRFGGIGIGLGEANVPAVTPEGKAFVEQKKHALFIEDVLADAQKAKRDLKFQKDFIKKFHGQDIVLLGGGHGSAIVIDLLLGFGPPEFYKDLPLEKFKPKSITWVGLKDPKGRPVTGDVFKEFIGGGTRYHHLASLIDDGTIKVIAKNAYVEPGKNKNAALFFWDKGAQQFEVDAKGHKVGVETDVVVYAAGYNFGPIEDMLSAYTPDGKAYGSALIKGDIAPNDARMTKQNVNLGKEVIGLDGNSSGIFLYGPSAGAIAEAADPGGAASPVINVMASRSKSLGDYLVKKYQALMKPKKTE